LGQSEAFWGSDQRLRKRLAPRKRNAIAKGYLNKRIAKT
jgi:hypothetical protein